MPGSILDTDTGFPEIAGKSQDRINREILDYLSMLQERLRWSMGNLGAENFNETAFQEIANYIREPVIVQLEDEEGRLASLAATAEGLTARLENAEGSLTALSATAEGLTARLTNAEGSLTALSATAEGLTARLTNAEGSLTALTATAEGLTGRMSDAEGNLTQLGAYATGLAGRMSDAEGNITTLTATASGLSTTVEGLGGQFSTLEQTVNGFTFRDAEGKVWINKGNIQLTGAISWDDLDSGAKNNIYAQHTYLPSYIQNTYIDSTEIRSPKILANVFEVHPINKGVYDGAYNLYGCLNGVEEVNFTIHYYSLDNMVPTVELYSPNGAFMYIGDRYGGEGKKPIFAMGSWNFDQGNTTVSGVRASGSWDFSKAVVSGLRIA